MATRQSEVNERDRKRLAVGRIVQTREAEMPYKVVFTDEDDGISEHSFATIRECEAFVRRNTPIPAERSRLYDREAGQA